MEPAVSRLEAALASTVIRKPRIPVISNVDAEPHADPETIKKILTRQVNMASINYLQEPDYIQSFMSIDNSR